MKRLSQVGETSGRVVVLTLRLKNGDKVTISNPDGTTTELLIRVNEGNAVKLGIRSPKEYRVSRNANKDARANSNEEN